MEQALREGAEQMRSLLATGRASPAMFRAALTRVPPADRDGWLDAILGIHECPDDGPELPRGCVPYMPCSVDTLLAMVDGAEVQQSDVFVDIGSGLGRAAMFTRFLTGAAAVGLEVQPSLAQASRDLAARLNMSRFSVVEGDAASLAGLITTGSVFFLYCPFSGARLEKVIDELEAVARARPVRVCCVDLPPLSRPWLTRVSPPGSPLAVYRSPPRGEWPGSRA